jgi:nucleoside-diphosphate-sugar epimerase
VNFCLAKGVKKLCYVSSTAALGDLASNETITEEIEWNPENRTVIMLF